MVIIGSGFSSSCKNWLLRIPTAAVAGAGSHFAKRFFLLEGIQWLCRLEDLYVYSNELCVLSLYGCYAGGTRSFADEALRVTALLPQAQLAAADQHSWIFRSPIASIKRCCGGAGQLVDFRVAARMVVRRALGLHERATLSCFPRGPPLCLPASATVSQFRTMAHSFIQPMITRPSHSRISQRAAEIHLTLLIDTYDTPAAARKVVALAPRLKAGDGITIRAVRIDSGEILIVILQGCAPHFYLRGPDRRLKIFGERLMRAASSTAPGRRAINRLRSRASLTASSDVRGARLRLQAPGIGRCATQAIRREGDVAGRKQDGVASGRMVAWRAISSRSRATSRRATGDPIGYDAVVDCPWPSLGDIRARGALILDHWRMAPARQPGALDRVRWRNRWCGSAPRSTAVWPVRKAPS